MALETSTLVYVLDLVGTASFAFSGALRSLHRRPDFVGVVVLAGATAVGGGLVRDVILDRRVVMLYDPLYPLMILLAAGATMLFPVALRRREGFFKYFDALGLGIFSAIGAGIAASAGLNPLSVLLIACLTGTGGGVVRDVLLGEMPLVLYREIYVSAVAAGAAALLIVHALGGGGLAAFLAALIVTTVLRVLAIRFNWSLPRLPAS